MSKIYKKMSRSLNPREAKLFATMVILGAFKAMFAGIAIALLFLYVVAEHFDEGLAEILATPVVWFSLCATIIYFIVGFIMDIKIEKYVEDKTS